MFICLQIPSSAALKITANSTRRARWNAKLGFCRQSWPFAISLNSVKFDGGVITRMKTLVIRVYPMVFMVKEKVDDGHKTGEKLIFTEITILMRFLTKNCIKSRKHSFLKCNR